MCYLQKEMKQFLVHHYAASTLLPSTHMEESRYILGFAVQMCRASCGVSTLPQP